MMRWLPSRRFRSAISFMYPFIVSASTLSSATRFNAKISCVCVITRNTRDDPPLPSMSSREYPFLLTTIVRDPP